MCRLSQYSERLLQLRNGESKKSLKNCSLNGLLRIRSQNLAETYLLEKNQEDSILLFRIFQVH